MTNEEMRAIRATVLWLGVLAGATATVMVFVGGLLTGHGRWGGIGIGIAGAFTLGTVLFSTYRLGRRRP